MVKPTAGSGPERDQVPVVDAGATTSESFQPEQKGIPDNLGELYLYVGDKGKIPESVMRTEIQPAFENVRLQIEREIVDRSSKAMVQANGEIEQLRSINARLTEQLEDKILINEDLKRANLTDSTGIGNWKAFRKHARVTLMQEKRARYIVFIMIDLVDFGTIDNQIGHAAGNDTLTAVARCLNVVVRGHRDLVARPLGPGNLGYDKLDRDHVLIEDLPTRAGGDEFALLALLHEPKGEEIALRAKEHGRKIDWYKGPEVEGLNLPLECREFLTANPLEMRAGVVNYLLPPMAEEVHERFSEEESDRRVVELFGVADQLMRDHKRDPEHPVHSVEYGENNGVLAAISEIKRVVLI